MKFISIDSRYFDCLFTTCMMSIHDTGLIICEVPHKATATDIRYFARRVLEEFSLQQKF